MADFWKRIAVLGLVAAAGCVDSFPPVAGPLDRFYYPVGLAVRRLPAGNTALLVVSSNFDLRYDYDVGGAVVAVDPDISGDARPVAEGGQADPTLAVLGGLSIGSFGGEVAYLAGDRPTEYPQGACPPLAAADALVAAGGAKVVVASRGKQEVYRVDMDAQGGLACDGCAAPTRPEAIDPYGVTVTCAQRNGESRVGAWVTHLRTPGNLAWLTKVDLLAQPPPAALVSRALGQVALGTTGLLVSQLGGATYTTTHGDGRLFVSTRIAAAGSAPLRWLDLFLEPVLDELLIVSGTHDVGADVKGALTRQLAVSGDGSRGYLQTELYDYDLAQRTGAVVATGGGLAIYDLTPTPFGDPQMTLLRFVSTCFGVGQVRTLPRPSPPGPSPLRDLVALTCPEEGTLLLYDDEVGAVVARIALDPSTGRPRLGRQPFGVAVEERDQCTGLPGPCTRLYVASFGGGFVNLLELDKWAPRGIDLVKRIGREQD